MSTNTVEADIPDPKAGKLLKDIADMNLITIQDASNDGFLKLLRKLRTKGKKHPITWKEITNEAESVRAARYARYTKKYGSS